jgi:hypothetical protein
VVGDENWRCYRGRDRYTGALVENRWQKERATVRESGKRSTQRGGLAVRGIEWGRV